MEKLSGIYKIENLVNGDCYIGQSVNLNKRKTAHINLLRNNKHRDIHLQRAFNKYGEENFSFKILLLCEQKCLTYYEQKLVDLWEPRYNIRKKCVDSNFGLKMSEETKRKISKSSPRLSGGNHPMYNKHHTVESRIKISNSIKGENHPNFGKHLAEETKKKMSETALKMSDKTKQLMSENHADFKGINHPRFTKKEVVIDIKNMLNSSMTIKEIHLLLNVGISTIRKVKNGYYDDIYYI